VELIDRMGGSFERALPGFDATAHATAAARRLLEQASGKARWPVVGEVDARTSRATFFDAPADSLPAFEELYARSPLWALSTGQPAFLRHALPDPTSPHERYQAHFAIRPAAKRAIAQRPGPGGKIYAVARLAKEPGLYFGTWMKVMGGGFLVFTPAARIVGELEIEKSAWPERDVRFTHVVLGVASYNTHAPEESPPEPPAKPARRTASPRKPSR
jgi:hypothetical protein